jgi:hypothetical protein
LYRHWGSVQAVRPIGTRRWWGVSVTLRPLFTLGKDTAPIVQEVGWAPGPFWTGAENLASTGIRCPDRPARSQSLYRLRYPAPDILNSQFIFRNENFTLYIHYIAQLLLIWNQYEISDITKGRFRNVNKKDKLSLLLGSLQKTPGCNTNGTLNLISRRMLQKEVVWMKMAQDHKQW